MRVLAGLLVVPAAGTAQERPAAAVGAPAMILAGTASGTRIETEVVIHNLSFTTDARGRLIDTGGDARRERNEVTIYDVRVHVDSAGFLEAARAATGPQEPLTPGDTGRRQLLALINRRQAAYDRLETDGKLADLVRSGQYARSVQLIAQRALKARHLRESLAEVLRGVPAGSVDDLARLTSLLRTDLARDDVVEMRIAPDGRIQVSVKGQVAGEVTDADLAAALCGAWLADFTFSRRTLVTAMPVPPGP
jgi:hypothetical protein